MIRYAQRKSLASILLGNKGVTSGGHNREHFEYDQIRNDGVGVPCVDGGQSRQPGKSTSGNRSTATASCGNNPIGKLGALCRSDDF